MINKSDIINFLFVISFAVYGVGTYVSATISPVIGYFVSMSMHAVILVFYLLDLAYKREFSIRVNYLFLVMSLYLLSCAVSYVVALKRGAINVTPVLVYSKGIAVMLPFYAFIAVYLYNNNDVTKVVKLTFWALSILVFINLFGFYVLGLENGVHSIEGRVNFPFLEGLYTGAGLLSVTNLMIYWYMRQSLDDPFRLTYLFVYFIFNLLILFLINSRLSNMVFLIVFLLFLFDVAKRTRLLFVVSIFTVPILLNAGLLVYRILSLPVFVFIMKRVNLRDVTTFNGRAYVWQRAVDWLLYDQRGLIFGNGSNGHYFLHMITDIAKLWGVQEEGSHLHSTVLMVLVDQGIVGYGLLIFLFYKMFAFFRQRSLAGKEEGIYFSVVVYMLIVMQVDVFVLGLNLGGLLFAFLMARVVLKDPA